MTAVALARRVVEVIADDGEGARPRYRYGSGCIVTGRTVLTSAHNVLGAGRVRVRGPDKRYHEVRVDPAFVDVNGDLALLDLGEDWGFPPMPVAELRRDSPTPVTVGCHTIGYPRFKERTGTDGTRIRETVGVDGAISASSNLVGGTLSMYCQAMPASLPALTTPIRNSPWQGMSGAPGLVDGKLVGVVTEHAPSEGPSTLTVAPLAGIRSLPNAAAWFARLGVADPETVPRLPRPPVWSGRTRRWMVVAAVSLVAGLGVAGAGLALPDEPDRDPAAGRSTTPPPSSPTSSPTSAPTKRPASTAPVRQRLTVELGGTGETDDGTVTIGLTQANAAYTGPDGTVHSGGGGTGNGGGGTGIAPDPDATGGSGVGGEATFFVRTPARTCRAFSMHIGEDIVITGDAATWTQVVLVAVELETVDLSATFDVLEGRGDAPRSERTCP